MEMAAVRFSIQWLTTSTKPNQSRRLIQDYFESNDKNRGSMPSDFRASPWKTAQEAAGVERATITVAVHENIFRRIVDVLVVGALAFGRNRSALLVQRSATATNRATTAPDASSNSSWSPLMR